MKFKSLLLFGPVMIAVALLAECTRPVSTLSETDFIQPPAENRPLALWTWMNGYVDTIILPNIRTTG